MGNLSSGKSALVHRYLTGTYVQEESPEGERYGPALMAAVPPPVVCAGAAALGFLSAPVFSVGSCGLLFCLAPVGSLFWFWA